MANLDMSLFSSWYLVQHVSWRLDAIKRPQNCWIVSHVDKGPSVKSTRLVRLSRVVTEEWFSISSGFQSLVTAQRQPLFSMLSGLDTAGKDLPALAELQQANDNLKAHCDLWLEALLQIHVGRSCSSLEEAFGKSYMCFCVAAFLWKMTSNTQLNKR